MPGAISIPNRYKPLLNELIKLEPEIGRWMLMGDVATRQYVVGVMAGQLVGGRVRPSEELANDVAHRPRQRVLEQAWNRPLKGWLRVLPKVGSAIHLPEFYASFLEAYSRPEIRKRLRHWRRPVTPRTLELLAAPSFSDLAPSLLESMSDPEQAEDVEAMRLTVMHVLGASSAGALRELPKCKTIGQVERWYQRWLEKAPFPQAPWPGDDYLAPLDSTDSIRKAADAFSNCLDTRLLGVHAGQRYYYTDRAMREIVIELEMGDFRTWKISEINGPGTKTPSARLRKDCRERLISAGFLPSTNGCRIW